VSREHRSRQEARPGRSLVARAWPALLLAACGPPAQDAIDAAELARVVSPDAELELLAGDLGFVEGPVWTDEEGGYLVFSDIRGGRLLRWTAAAGVELYRSPSPEPNGNARDAEGRLLTCEHAARRVTRIERDGSGTVLADRYRGKRLNSPNDVVVAADGAVWFTDPPYGIPRGQVQEQAGSYVFRIDPVTLAPSVVITDFDRPNGLCFAPDGRILYVADSGVPGHVRAFDVGPSGALSGDRIFYASAWGHPDGIRCDADGRLYVASADGVHVVLPDGRLIGRLRTLEPARNLCFGEADRRTLFVTAGSSLYSIRLEVSGP